MIEHDWTRTVRDQFLGIPGHGRRISVRTLHVWELREGPISRENVWLDGPAIIGPPAGDRQPAGARP
ncbi:MAG TPA: hypothetical protein VFD49_04385 [Candidatus Dormibacteraeota bacterium]|nr:hypothetical protein [Candidatus Dormibacteraeota bacterium]